ncbi:Transposase [Acinetobacter kyonggiensis]|uniref:Transposase n=1 Tax=Acinetobacter kyonggiensis TaxID=595670 RepID=A0A1H3MRB6_9GAMM|nr:Transposase [Acinetobacter kyonggiensis]
MVGEARISNGRKEQTSFIIIDSQSVKNTDTARDKGYDAGKKVSGIKRHIIVDTQGLPHGILVTTADKTDHQGALDAVRLNKQILQNVEVVLLDGGYTGEPFSLAVKNLIRARVEVAKRSELHRFAVIPQRWVVERSFAWLEKCRRLWKNCERYLNTSLQFINLAFLRLLLHRKYSG